MDAARSPRRGIVASLHRLLLRRLAAMTAVICVALGGAAALHQVVRYDEVIIEYSLAGAEDFRALILPQLDAPGPVGPEEGSQIQQVLDALPEEGRTASRLGFTASVRILDGQARPVAHRAATDYRLAREVAAYFAAHPYAFKSGQPTQSSRLVNIGGRPHLHLAVSLTDSQGNVAAFAESVYAVSGRVLDDVAAGALGTVALVVLVALATTLLLYPVIVRLLRRVTRLSVHLQEANLETLRVLGSAIAKRDSDTDRHNYRVTIYSVRLAEALGLPDASIRPLVKGAMLHDVGKIGIRDAVLLKPGALTDGEFHEMQEHVQHGRDIVSQASWLADAMDVVGSHHERYDGGGYDHGLAGAAIPLAARIFTVADVFDALTSRRPYKEPYPFAEAMRMLEIERGTRFDPAVLDAFRNIAKELYANVADCDEAALKAALDGIFRRYFTSDLEAMLQGMEEIVSGRGGGTAPRMPG